MRPTLRVARGCWGCNSVLCNCNRNCGLCCASRESDRTFAYGSPDSAGCASLMGRRQQQIERAPRNFADAGGVHRAARRGCGGGAAAQGCCGGDADLSGTGVGGRLGGGGAERGAPGGAAPEPSAP
eukprot:1446770-Rhodomonas_salina.1